MKSIRLLISGSLIFEFLPILSHVPTWVPCAGYLRELVDVRRAVHRLRDLPWGDARAVVVVSPSLVLTLLLPPRN